jgi:hypothetical protein
MVWKDYSLRPDHFLVCCMECSRVKMASGEWVAIPPALGRTFHLSLITQLSHGLCPECRAKLAED